MSNENNDKKILALKEQIKVKKEKLNKSYRFSPLTNCSIELDGVRYNINTLTVEQLMFMMIRLNTYKMSSEQLKYEYPNISGYLLTDWMDDIESKIAVLSVKEEENKLKSMENKLEKMLSNEKKTELEIDEIANLLK